MCIFNEKFSTQMRHCHLSQYLFDAIIILKKSHFLHFEVKYIDIELNKGPEKKKLIVDADIYFGKYMYS